MREQSCILESCCLSPIRRNSVLEDLRVRISAVIQEEICCRAFCKWLMLEWKSDGWKERRRLEVVCHLRIGSDFKERDETKVLSGVVYMTKSRGPSTEPWETRYGDDVVRQNEDWAEWLTVEKLEARTAVSLLFTHLLTRHAGDKLQRPQNTKRPQRFHVERLELQRRQKRAD